MFDRNEIEKAYNTGTIIIFNDKYGETIAQIANTRIPLVCYIEDIDELENKELMDILWNSFMEFSESPDATVENMFSIKRELQNAHIWYPRSQYIKKTNTESAIELITNTGVSRQKAKAILQQIGYILFNTEVFPKSHKRTANVEKMLNIGPRQYPSGLIKMLDDTCNDITFPDYTCDFCVYKATRQNSALYYIYPNNKNHIFKSSKKLFPGLEEIFKMAEKFKFNVICLDSYSDTIPGLPIYDE